MTSWRFNQFLLLVVALSVASALRSIPACSAEIEGKSAHANTSIWTWERLLDGQVVDAGEVIMPHPGLKEFEIPSTAGGMLRLSAVRFPYPPGEPFPQYDLNTRYFNGLDPELGLISAELKEEGESWRFGIGERLITDDSAFSGGTQSYIVRTQRADGKEVVYDSGSGNGFWMYVECTSGLKWAYGAPGAQYQELKDDWLDAHLCVAELPRHLGSFCAFELYAGQVWTIEIGGEVYQASAALAD